MRGWVEEFGELRGDLITSHNDLRFVDGRFIILPFKLQEQKQENSRKDVDFTWLMSPRISKTKKLMHIYGHTLLRANRQTLHYFSG